MRKPMSKPRASPDETLPAARKQPAQIRSKERLERILGTARELIAHKGSDLVKMSEIAALAEISIGSLYQYFPDKSALIRTLAELYNAESRLCIAAALEGVKDLKGLLEAYCSLVDQYFAIVTAEPVMRDIWSGMQADKQLMALQLAESRICGEMLASAMRRVHPKANRKRLDESAFLIWELGEATVRLAISVPSKEGRALVETFKRITVRELEDPPPSAGD